jgi:hypothetical protein
MTPPRRPGVKRRITTMGDHGWQHGGEAPASRTACKPPPRGAPQPPAGRRYQNPRCAGQRWAPAGCRPPCVCPAAATGGPGAGWRVAPAPWPMAGAPSPNLGRAHLPRLLLAHIRAPLISSVQEIRPRRASGFHRVVAPGLAYNANDSLLSQLILFPMNICASCSKVYSGALGGCPKKNHQAL